MSFLSELKRRHVYRAGAAYMVLAWLIIQVAETVLPLFGIEEAIIRTVVIVLGIGLIPVVISAWAFELTPEGIKRDSDVDFTAENFRRFGKKIDRWVIVLLVLALAFFAFDKFVLDPVRDAELVNSTIDNLKQPTLNQPTKNSIAVLPFANMSPDPDQEYFADGLAEEILNVLSRVPGLAVVSRTSSFAYKGTNLNVAQIADELKARYMVEGSVRKAGDLLRVVVKLIDATSGQQLWVEDFDGNAGEVFEIQDRTANAILMALKIQTESSREQLSNISGTSNVLAHNLFLKGRYHFNQRNLRLAVDLFEQAVQADSQFGEAYALLALAKSLGHGARDSEGSYAAVKQAIELAPESPETLIAQGWTARMTNSFAEADRVLRRAVELYPRNGMALHLLGWVQFSSGRYEEARHLGMRAVEVDPSVVQYRNSLGFYCMALGLFEAGMAHFSAANAINIRNYGTQLIWKIILGESDSVLEILDDTDIRLHPFWRPYHRALALIYQGRQSEARDLLSAIEEDPSGGPDEAIVISRLYLGDVEKANRAMKMIIENGGDLNYLRSYLPYLKDFPIEKTQFNELQESLGLPGFERKI